MSVDPLRRFVLFAFLLLVLPGAALAGHPAVECSALEGPTAELAASLFAEDPVGEIVAGVQEPAPQCSTYSCSGMFDECPDIIDMPPGECINGCCVYESECQSTCHFDSDCGEQASCWSGCCYSWNR